MKIYITQPTSPEYYTNESADEARVPTVAQNCLALGIAYAQQRWPEAEVDGELVTETQSFGNRGYVEGTEAEEQHADDTLEAINAYVGRHCFEQELWSADFDAAAYLAQHAL